MNVPARKISIAHVLFRFSTGGMENGLVNLINHLDETVFEHSIICLSGYDPEFAQRIRTSNVTLCGLDKQPGHDLRVYRRLYKTLKQLRPDVVHTRNFGALDSQIIAGLLGVRRRIHGEHGWDVDDLTGGRPRSRIVRRVVGRIVHRFVTVSNELRDYVIEQARVPAAKVVRIYNGVDTARFHPAADAPHRGPVVIGTVGRMQTVKNQVLLARAFVRMIEVTPSLRQEARLRLVGDGPLLAACRDTLRAADLLEQADIVGPSDNVAQEMQSMDVFVLPSLAEGISNTILEAMASGLPVIATAVGGNVELVSDEHTGCIVPSDDVDAMANAMKRYVEQDGLRRTHGNAGRERAQAEFTLDAMVSAYHKLYADGAELT